MAEGEFRTASLGKQLGGRRGAREKVGRDEKSENRNYDLYDKPLQTLNSHFHSC
jgi:hypothetical protein